MTQDHPASDTRFRIALFGSSPDTGNLGVSALYESICAGLRHSLPNTDLTVFDNGLGTRRATTRPEDGTPQTVEFRGARAGRRYWRGENLLTMATAACLGSTGARLNGNVAAIDRCQAVLDISGGDSFSDIYGAKRFWSVARPKLLALRRRRPLILLPQTYGPFKDPRLRAVARTIVRGAAQCWARDANSYTALQELAGAGFDPERHRSGVDLAFGLPATPCREALELRLLAMIDADRTARPLVGLNVSGLIHNDPAAAQQLYGLKANYGQVIEGLLNWLLNSTRANVVLVPHVHAPIGHYESDLAACQAAASSVETRFRDRVCIAPDKLSASEVKWLIGQTDWFCGTRMHSTIAALSNGVPTATVSYSDKALGVFETCDQGNSVIDPRRLGTQSVLTNLNSSFDCRRGTAASLAIRLPSVRRTLALEWNAICKTITCARLCTQDGAVQSAASPEAIG